MLGSTVDMLRSVPLFTGMTDTAIEAIEAIVEPLDYAAGATLVREGDPGDRFIVLVEGRARVEQDGRPIRELGRGDFLGEIALLDGRSRTATVIALEPIHALTIRSEAFLDLVDRHAAIRLLVISALTDRIRAAAPSPVD